MLIFVEGGKPQNLEKNPRSKDKNQQQTQPTYDAGSGNRTRASAVGGECSHHCAIRVPLVISRTIGLIAKLWHCLPTHTLLSIYQALIASYSTYSLTVWGWACKSYLTSSKSCKGVEVDWFVGHVFGAVLLLTVMLVVELFLFPAFLRLTTAITIIEYVEWTHDNSTEHMFNEHGDPRKHGAPACTASKEHA